VSSRCVCSLPCTASDVGDDQRFKVTVFNDTFWIKRFKNQSQGRRVANDLKREESASSSLDCDSFLRYAKEHIAEFESVTSIRARRFKTGWSSTPFLITNDDGSRYVLKMHNARQSNGARWCGWSISSINHSIAFKFKLLQLLHEKTDIPIPRMVHLCKTNRCSDSSSLSWNSSTV